MQIKLISIRKKMGQIVKLANGLSLEDIACFAMKVLKEGKVIALPTDTIYGIASLAQNAAAVKRLYDIKGRDFKKPVAICIGCIADIPRYGKVSFPKEILHDLLPGPVTLLMEPQLSLNTDLLDTPLVGIRLPKSPFIQHLALLCDEPLALTSANISSMSNALETQEFKEIWPHLDLIVDGGVLGQQDPKRLGSTVVDLSIQGCFKINRAGCSLETTRNVLLKNGLTEL